MKLVHNQLMRAHWVKILSLLRYLCKNINWQMNLSQIWNDEVIFCTLILIEIIFYINLEQNGLLLASCEQKLVVKSGEFILH